MHIENKSYISLFRSCTAVAKIISEKVENKIKDTKEPCKESINNLQKGIGLSGGITSP